jgi:hypothetical protein
MALEMWGMLPHCSSHFDLCAQPIKPQSHMSVVASSPAGLAPPVMSRTLVNLYTTYSWSEQAVDLANGDTNGSQLRAEWRQLPGVPTQEFSIEAAGDGWHRVREG